MKKNLSLCVIVAMVFASSISLCFGASAKGFDTELVVEAAVSSSFEISEKVTVGWTTYMKKMQVSDLIVKNLTADYGVRVRNIRAEGSNGWEVVDATTVDNADTNTKCISLSIDGQDLATEAGYNSANELIKGVGKKKTYYIDGTVAVQSRPTETEKVADLIITVSIDPIINGMGVEDLKAVQWATGSSAEIVAVIKAIDSGYINPAELTGWDVGAERQITIPTMATTYDFTDTDGTNYTGSLSAASQTATLVIMDTPGSAACSTKKWNDDGGRTKETSYIVGFKNCIVSTTMDSATTWKTTNVRAWCNSTFYEAMLTAFGVTASDNFFKKVANVTGSYSADDTIGGGSNVTTDDYFALPAAYELYLSPDDVPVDESEGVAQFSWYATEDADHVTKMLYDSGTSSYSYYLRTPSRSTENSWCEAGSSASTNNTHGISPFGCL
jgi:hypothetical protein